jgi:hypothetical protein
MIVKSEARNIEESLRCQRTSGSLLQIITRFSNVCISELLPTWKELVLFLSLICLNLLSSFVLKEFLSKIWHLLHRFVSLSSVLSCLSCNSCPEMPFLTQLFSGLLTLLSFKKKSSMKVYFRLFIFLFTTSSKSVWVTRHHWKTERDFFCELQFRLIHCHCRIHSEIFKSFSIVFPSQKEWLSISLIHYHC